MEPPTWVVVGIDPGKTGGFAMLFPDREAEVWRVDTGSSDLLDLLETAKGMSPRLIVAVERVHGRGGWSATANFSLGGSASVPSAGCEFFGGQFVDIAPITWHREAWGESQERMTYDERKRKSQRKAEERWGYPHLQSGQADALWIAMAACKRLGLTPHKW